MHLHSNRQEPRIHGLVNNAGIMATPYEKTIDGYEAQFQVYITYNTIPAVLMSQSLPNLTRWKLPN